LLFVQKSKMVAVAISDFFVEYFGILIDMPNRHHLIDMPNFAQMHAIVNEL